MRALQLFNDELQSNSNLDGFEFLREKTETSLSLIP